MRSLLFHRTLAPMVHRGLKTETRRRHGTANIEEFAPFYARESFRLKAEYNTMSPKDAMLRAQRREVKLDVWYDADGDAPTGERWGRGRPGIHMPAMLARTTLVCDEFRSEPLNDIDEHGARREGFESRDAFIAAWVSFYGRLSWVDNPVIDVIRFHRIGRYEDDHEHG